MPSGNQSLYLEFYEKGGKRRYESLKLYLIPEKDENDRRVNENTLKHALKLKSERVLGIEHPQETGEKKLPSKAFADFMDEYQVYLRDIKRASDSYQKMNRSTINIVKSYLTSIRRPRVLLSKVDKQAPWAYQRPHHGDLCRRGDGEESGCSEPCNKRVRVMIYFP